MNIATISDLRAPAKRRLPSFVFDYLDGGAGTNTVDGGTDNDFCTDGTQTNCPDQR